MFGCDEFNVSAVVSIKFLGQSPAQAVDALTVAESSSVNTDLRYPIVKNSTNHQSQEKSPDQLTSNCLTTSEKAEDNTRLNCTDNDRVENVEEELDDETAKALGGRLAKVCLNRLTKEVGISNLLF